MITYITNNCALQGVSVDLRVWDEDAGNMVRPRELVDTFHFDYYKGTTEIPVEKAMVGKAPRVPNSRFIFRMIFANLLVKICNNECVGVSKMFSLIVVFNTNTVAIVKWCL